MIVDTETISAYVQRASLALREMHGDRVVVSLEAVRQLTYSLSLRLLVGLPGGDTERVFVKVRRPSGGRTSANEADVDRAIRRLREEYTILTRARAWSHANDPSLDVVEPLGYLDDCNALLLRQARGRSLDSLVARDHPLSLPAIVRAGRWLRAFHSAINPSTLVPWSASAYLTQTEALVDGLVADGVDPAVLRELREGIRAEAQRFDGMVCARSCVHGDYKLRHIWADTNALQVLDFGNCHDAFIVEDLAAFIIELEVRDLGALRLRRPLTTTASAVFLEAYGPIASPGILSLQLIFARLKKWQRRRRRFSRSRTARRLQSVLATTGTAEVFLSTYVDPFFVKRVESELGWLHMQPASEMPALGFSGQVARDMTTRPTTS